MEPLTFFLLLFSATAGAGLLRVLLGLGGGLIVLPVPLQRDSLYVAITLFVLVVLGLSLLSGIG
jgi:hypothetical protein